MAKKAGKKAGSKAKQSRLQAEIDRQRATIHSDQYSVSIGEIASMYEAGELDIHPEFQRYYRWDVYQKSRFIESILLGIPIPSFFVAQREDGKWDVVDGLQRLSTIFQFLGILQEEDGSLVEPLRLTRVHLLPAMEGMTWNTDPALSDAQRLYVKRAKLDFKIILRQSTESAKFELFQRLNTGGSELSDQEIRNAMLVASVPHFEQWLAEMSQERAFQDCVVLSERSYQERFDMELVLRFRALHSDELDDVKRMQDLSDYLTDTMRRIAKTFQTWKVKETRIFRTTFELLAESCAGNAFRKWDEERNRATGGFSISAFEVLAMGVGHAVARDVRVEPARVREVAHAMWTEAEFRESSGSGVRASTRIPRTLGYGRRKFA